MKLLVFIALVATVAAAAYVVNRKKTRGAAVPDDSRANAQHASVAMRDALLAATAADFELTPTSGGVWGVLMEMGYPEGWAAIVALSDGSASLYTSTGGGIIGGFAHERVAHAARVSCATADGVATSVPFVFEFQPPSAGRITLRLLTVEGVRSIDESEEALVSGASSRSALFFSMNDVLTELRRATPSSNGD
jgi:hypothetical protein